MNVFHYVTEDELAQAPQDPSSAFAYFINLAQVRFRENTRGLGDDNDAWRIIQDEKFHLHNYIIGVAKTYGIDPFQEMEVPDPEDYDTKTMRRFESDLNHYMTQLVHGNAIRERRDSVEIAPKLKDRLRSHIHALKTVLDDADLPESKKEAMHKKLREFEEALDSNRIAIWKIATYLVGFMSITANGLQIYESPAVHKLVNNMWSVLAEAKAADEDQRKLPPFDPPKALLPPRRREQPSGPRETFSSDLDDEIPF